MTESDPVLVQAIKIRLENVEANVAEAAERSGRASSDVLILAVSKRQPVSVIEAAYASGLRYFGENYAEEASEKIAQFADFNNIHWEMIGHIQSRKSGRVAADFSRVHSLDSLKLARRLDAAREEHDNLPALEVLLELNVSGETSKEGIPAWQEGQWEELLPIVSDFADFKNLHLTGLMTMPPLFDDPQESRPFLQRLRLVRDHLNAQIPGLGLTELSMGTSLDYRVAVEEGATIIRLGQALLGPRTKLNGN